MSVYSDNEKFINRREELLESLEDAFESVLELADTPDPSGYRVGMAKDILAGLARVLDQLQANSHDIEWSQLKINLIDRCMRSDRLQ